MPADATPFDIVASLASSHHGASAASRHSSRHELDDPVLWDLARIVHEADLADERYDAPEARGLDVLIRGLSLT